MDIKNNTGNKNSGHWNSGHWNSGKGNSGDRNSGNGNSGDRNSGNGNSGNGNSGDWNSGYRNTGDGNSGDWNSGDGNSGYFNIDEPKVRIFGKETDVLREDLVFPKWFCFDLNTWVETEDMTEQEKIDNDQYEVTGGFLRTLEYKEAWRKAWDGVDETERRKVFELPNWDNEIFKEITGIDVEAELAKDGEELTEDDKEGETVEEIVLNGKRYRLV